MTRRCAQHLTWSPVPWSSTKNLGVSPHQAHRGVRPLWLDIAPPCSSGNGSSSVSPSRRASSHAVVDLTGGLAFSQWQCRCSHEAIYGDRRDCVRDTLAVEDPSGATDDSPDDLGEALRRDVAQNGAEGCAADLRGFLLDRD